MTTWASMWAVVMCYPDGTLHQHNFALSHKVSQALGVDRAEVDARKFAKDFEAVARIMYCGPIEQMPPGLRQDVVLHHHCSAAG